MTLTSVSSDSEGFIGGGHVGYQHQFSNIVVGVEVGVSGADLDKSVTQSFALSTVAYGTEIDTMITVAGRIGVAMSHFLPYVKVGYATADINMSGNATVVGLGSDSFSNSDWESGWIIGGGVETMLGKNFVAGVEYNYIDLGKSSYSGRTARGISYSLTDVDTDIQSLTGAYFIQIWPGSP
ncbi:MAG: outer membrane beta-barrel protein [Hyphomicrobium sp.]|nr:outer membrane beta-barrel protein [Hyphomicrobium sp.]